MNMGMIGNIFYSAHCLSIYRPIDVGVAETWDPGFGEFLRNSYHYHPRNLDHNSGNPIGISVCQQREASHSFWGISSFYPSKSYCHDRSKGYKNPD